MASSPNIDATLAKLVAHEKRPLDALATLGQARQTLEQLTQAYVTRARRNGASWTEVGLALGTSKQAAWERFGDKI